MIPNGVDLEAFLAGVDGAKVRERYGLGERFVCAYLGTIGMGCGLEVVLRAARRLREAGRDDVRFLLVGDGAVREELEAQARARGARRRSSSPAASRRARCRRSWPRRTPASCT